MKKLFIFPFFLATSLLLGCGQEVVVEEITEEQINQIIDEMPEVKSTIPLTDEFRKEQREYNLEKYKENAEKATGFKIREYKDYWILENKEEGFGLRLPYDSSFFSDENVTNYTVIFRPEADNSSDTDLSCSSEMYIYTDKTFDEWKEQRQTNYVIHEEKEIINDKKIYYATGESEFSNIYGFVIIEGNNNIYSFGNSSRENNVCKNTHKEIVDSYFFIP